MKMLTFDRIGRRILKMADNWKFLKIAFSFFLYSRNNRFAKNGENARNKFANKSAVSI